MNKKYLVIPDVVLFNKYNYVNVPMTKNYTLEKWLYNIPASFSIQ